MDINGGAGYPNANGSPLLPGSTFTGPLIAGNIMHGDGSGVLAGVGATGPKGTANAGYAVMAQVAVITQANGTSPGAPNGVATAGVFTTWIVIPAQSQITAITLMVTTAFTGGATTLGIGTTASATALTAASAVVTSGALGKVILNPGTGATQIGNWDNVGNTDIQIVVTSTNTGSGVGTLTVEYIQSVNNAS
jgi:hypothetical protein